MKIRVLLFFILFFKLLCGCLLAGEEGARLRAFVSTDTITIGDRFEYVVEVVYKPGVLLGELVPSDGLGMFEIKDYDISIPKKKSWFSKDMIKRFKYILSTFTVGDYKIPGILLSYKDLTGEDKEIKTDDIIIKVLPTMSDANNLGTIIDIKEPIHIPLPILVYLIVLAVFLLLGLLGLGYYLYKNRKLAKIFKVQKPKEPAHIIALRELNKLKGSEFLDKGEIKEFYIILSEVFKEYLEDRYNVDVLDKTTYEVYHELRDDTSIDRKLIVDIREFLEECDLVKFAKYAPDNNIISTDFDKALEFINITKIEEVVEEIKN